MNPFTRAIMKRGKTRSLRGFVDHLDRLEALIIHIHRQAQAEPVDAAEYLRLQSWLKKHYPKYQADLEPYWRSVKAGGEVITQDPILELLSAQNAEAFVENWRAMQILPAVREAFNRYLIDALA